jgi:glycosyltransferase involved in cell wall biosynthesis
MGTGRIEVLVLLNTADESEVPLLVASHVERFAPDDIEQTVCSFYPPETETFGVNVVSLEGTHRLDLGAYRRLAELIRGADVVHVHPPAVGVFAKLMAAVDRVSVVKTEHNTHTDWSVTKNAVNGTTNVLTDTVVAVSEAVAESFGRWERAFLRFGGVDDVVIPNGADVAAVRTATKRDPPVELPAGFLVGGGGRMVTQKNLDTLIKAMRVVSEDCPDVSLVLTGDGPQRDRLEDLARRAGVTDSVVFTGYLPRLQDVHAVLGRCDLYAMPSRHEGFPGAALESMSAGVPLVVSDIPPLREALADAARFVDPDDPASVATAITELHDDPARRRSLASRALERVRERFPVERTAREHVALYRAVSTPGG